MLAAIPLSVLLMIGAPASSSSATGQQELSFGIEVAQKGLWREALFRFERAALLDPGNPSAQNNLAVALEQAGRFEEAREAYEKALELKPDNLYIQQNYDLFREADDKRNRKKKRRRRP